LGVRPNSHQSPNSWELLVPRSLPASVRYYQTMTSLSILQNRMKRDPVSYKDDFVRQLAHFEVSSLKELYHEIPDVI
jgi:hypothetical protein